MNEPTPLKEETQVVESGKRLSECLLWRLQEEFYANSGLDAWDVIPYYPTSNPAIGSLYAELIVRFLQDIHPTLDPAEPVYIFELATGSGAFSFYLLKALKPRLEAFEALRSLKLRYVMTDFTDAIVGDWSKSDALKPFLEADLLDFAVFRPEEQQELQLIRSGETLSPGYLKNPAIAIANYFFDSIRQDQFRVEDHRLMETRLTFTRSLEGLAPDSPVTLQQLEKTETYHPVEGPYYDNPGLNQLLEHYRATFQQASILFPIGAFRCLENLLALSGDRLMLIAADKGFSRSDYMQGHKEQSYMPHAGAFSYMVNFDALGRYFEFQQGIALLDEGHTSILNLLTGIVLKGQGTSLEQTRYAFEQQVIQRDAANSVNLARRLVNPERYDELSLLRGAMGLIQLSQDDPMVFAECAQHILKGLDGHLFVTDYHGLLGILDRVRRNIFVPDPKAHAYHYLEKVYYKLKHSADCRAVALECMERFGPSAHSLLHVAAAYELEGERASAYQYYQKAAEYDPASQLIQDALLRLKP